MHAVGFDPARIESRQLLARRRGGSSNRHEKFITLASAGLLLFACRSQGSARGSRRQCPHVGGPKPLAQPETPGTSRPQANGSWEAQTQPAKLKATKSVRNAVKKDRQEPPKVAKKKGKNLEAAPQQQVGPEEG
jgi:hypothetical protein